jgi:putative oxidoreductase
MTEDRRPAATEIVYACVRVVSAWVFLQHGAAKLLGVLGGFGAPGATAHFPSLMFLAGVIELGGGILILLGLGTRPVAFIASGEMATAYFMSHAPRGLVFTMVNHGELPAIFSFLFLYFALQGGGRYSLDALISRSRHGTSAPARQPI